MSVDHNIPFADRADGGRALAARLERYAGRAGVIVLALPRGGVPVAEMVAAALGALLDVFLVRKLGVPGQPELAMGAIASGGVRVLNDEALRWYHITPQEIDRATAEEQRELARRDLACREGRPLPALAGRTIILVDDGLATGSTMRAAVQAVRLQQPERIVVAVPVGAEASCRGLAAIADDVECVRMPDPFSAVGQWYLNFDQTSDAEVRTILRRAASVTLPVRESRE